MTEIIALILAGIVLGILLMLTQRNNAGLHEIIRGWLRRALVFFFAILCIVLGGYLFESVDVIGMVNRAREIDPFLRMIPTRWLQEFTFLFHSANLRYILPFFGALVFVFVVGAFYVQDIYNLRRVRDALRYVVSSMFAWNYPHLHIDNGQMQIEPGDSNLLRDIGGPGHVMVQPGNLVAFENLRGLTRTELTRAVVSPRFEVVSLIASLDDQHGEIDRIEIMTRDGILVRISEINYRYRIQFRSRYNQILERSLANPYPFDPSAIRRMVENQRVGANGVISWAEYMRTQITRVMAGYVSSHSIDELTAPRQGRNRPREEIRRLMFSTEMTQTLANNGTQLTQINIGRFEALPEGVDDTRINLWAESWIGNEKVQQALTDSKRKIYMEQGRAEGNAMMIAALMEALRSAGMGTDPVKNVRTLFLARMAQLMDAMASMRMGQDEAGEKKP